MISVLLKNRLYLSAREIKKRRVWTITIVVKAPTGENTTMGSRSLIAIEGEQHDKLSNLARVLVSIEQCEGDSENRCKLEPARKTLIDAVKGFERSRFILGRALAVYKPLFKQEKHWLRAQDEIATALGCSARTVSRIIEESEMAAELHPFVLEAMERHRTDPGKKKNAPVVQELLKCPIAKSRKQADAAVRSAVSKVTGKQKANAKPALDPRERFASRIVKLFYGHLEGLAKPGFHHHPKRSA